MSGKGLIEFLIQQYVNQSNLLSTYRIANLLCLRLGLCLSIHLLLRASIHLWFGLWFRFRVRIVLNNSIAAPKSPTERDFGASGLEDNEYNGRQRCRTDGNDIGPVVCSPLVALNGFRHRLYSKVHKSCGPTMEPDGQSNQSAYSTVFLIRSLLSVVIRKRMGL